MDREVGTEQLALRRILSILRRRWLIILVAVLVTPSVVVAGSLTQTAVYESSSDVLLSYQNLAGSLTGTADSSAAVDPERAAATQAQLARVPTVAARTLAAAGLSDRDVDDFLGSSSVSASDSSDLLTFSVQDEDRALASRLATEYATQFIAYRLELDTAAIERARTELQARIREVREEGGGDSSLLATLVDKDQTLQTLQSLQTSNALLVREGSTADQVAPRPVRSGVIALGLGLLVGIGFAFLRETLDTSVRSADEISERLGLTLLARLPEPPRRLRAANRLAMVEQPSGIDAEAFRMLRTNIEFADLGQGPRVIAVTSAVSGEGKSTTAANLAVAFARAGRAVILVDLDLRRPSLHTFFDLAGRPGVTDVVLGTHGLEEALATVALDGDRSATAGVPNGTPAPARLRVLTSGPLPHDTGEFVGGAGLATLINGLRSRADLVIVDTPPLLQVGDTMTMSVNLDAVILVTRINVASRRTISETSRLLRRMRAAKAGLVVTGTQAEDDYTGGYFRVIDELPAEDLPARRAT